MKKHTILLVEDNHYLIEGYAEILEMLDYEVFTAESGSEALKVFEKNWHAFDLIWLDFNLSDMTANELIPYIRHLRREVPILVVSEVTRLEKRLLPVDVNVHMIRKPTFTDQIIDEMDNLLAPESAGDAVAS